MSIATPPATAPANMSPDMSQSAPIAAIDPAQCDRTEADRDLQKQQKAAWDAYYGKFRDSVDSEPGKRNRNVKSNRCAAIVDKGASWLAGPGVDFEVADKGAPESKDGKPKPKKPQPPAMPMPAMPMQAPNMPQQMPAPNDPNVANVENADPDGDGIPDAEDPADQIDPRQTWLDDFLGNADKIKTFGTMLYTMGGVTGHAYVKLVYNEDTDKKPRYTLLDSQNVYVLTDPDDCNIPCCYVVEYETPLRLLSAGGQPQKIIKRQIICRCAPDGTPRYGTMKPDGTLPPGVGDYDDENDRWTIATYVRTTTAGISGAGKWTLVGDVIEWDYPFAPIVDAMNLPAPNQYYGLSDLPQEIVALNEKLNDVQTDTATILEVFSMPIPYATGFGGVNTIQTHPGDVLMLPAESQPGVLQPRGDVASNRDFANDLRADMDEQSRVPAVALGRQESLPKGNISGIALGLMFQPLVEKTMLKRALYGPMLQELCLRAMAIAKVADYGSAEVRLHWGDLLPKDDAATAQMALALSQVGASQHAIDQVLGLDYDEEQAYKQEEQESQLTAFSRGQGLPPVGDPMQQTATTPDGTPAPAQDATAPNGGNGQTPPTMHPASVQARQRMQAANGKPVTPTGM